MMLVYILAITISATWITKMVVSRTVIFRKTLLDIPILLFCISQIISTIISIHPRTSVFGYYSRFNGGLLSVFAYISLFYAFVSNVTKQQAISFIKTLILSATFVSLYAIPEHFGVSPSCIIISGETSVSCWVQDVQNRVFGTFGQPNWLAAYVAAILPLTLAMGYKEAKKSFFTIPTPFFYAFAIVVSTMALLFTNSRSGILACAIGLIGLFVFGVLQIIRVDIHSIKSTLRSRYTATFLLLLGALILPILVFGSPFNPPLSSFFSTQKQDVIQPTPVGGSQMETGGTESGSIRKIVWKGAIDIWKRYPIFGSGVETFAYSYYRDRPKDHNLVSEWDFLYNKAHNEYLNYLATTGIVGLLTYLSFSGLSLLLLLYWLLRNWEHSFVLSALIVGLVSIWISNFFGFSTVMISVIFFLFPAIGYTLSQKELEIPKQKPSTSSVYFINTIIWIFAALLIWKVGSFWVADKTFAMGKRLESQGDQVSAYHVLTSATQLIPDEPTYHDELSLLTAKLAVGLMQENEATAAAILAQQAIQESDTAVLQNPMHLNFYKTRARVFIFLAQLNPQALDEAVRTLEHARNLAPTDAKLPYNIAVIKQTQGKNDEAKELLLHTIDLKTNYEDARMALSKVYETEKEYEEAIEQLQFILKFIAPNNEAANKKMQELLQKSQK